MSEIAVKLNGGGNLTDAMKQARRAVDEVKESLSDIGKHKHKFEEIANSGKPLQAELAKIKKLLGEMKFQGLEGTEEFQQITRLAGEMADAIADANAQVKYFANDTKTLSTVVEGFQAVAGAISVAQGALALFGADNERLEQTLKKVQGAIALVNGVQTIANALNKDSNLIMGIANMQKQLAIKWSKAHKGAILSETAATKGATLATKALNTVLKANPIGLVITAITTLIGLLTIFSGKSDEATDSMSSQEAQAKRLAEEHEKLGEAIGTAVGDNVSKFMQLANEWTRLKTIAEQTAWIQNNANSFKQLGLNIKSAADAQKVFVDMLPKVIELMEIMGKISGLESAQAEVWKEYYLAKAKREVDTSRKLYGPETRFIDNATDMAWMEKNLVEGRDYIRRTYSEYVGTSVTGVGTYITREYLEPINHGLDKLNNHLSKVYKKWDDTTNTAMMTEAEKKVATFKKDSEQLYTEAAQIRNEIGSVVFDPKSSVDPYKEVKAKPTSTPKTSTPKQTKVREPQNAREVKKELDEKLTELEQLQKERDEIIAELNNPKFAKRLTRYERHTRENRIAELNEQIESIKKWTGEMMFVRDLNDNEIVIPLEFTFDKQKVTENLKKDLKDIDLTGITPLEVDVLLSPIEKKTIDIFNNAHSGVNQVLDWFNAGLIGKQKAEEMINAFNAQLLAVGFEPITINLDTEKFKSDAEKVSNTIGNISGAVAQAFGAMNDALSDSKEQDVALNAAKIIAQAVATLALSFAQAMGKEGKSGVWGWIAAGITGMATLLTMVGQLNKLSTYATGGIVGGNSYVGDRQLIRVNSGEMVLNKRQQANLFNVLDGHGAVRGNTSSEITWRLRGADIYGSLKNYNTTKGLTR